MGCQAGNVRGVWVNDEESAGCCFQAGRDQTLRSSACAAQKSSPISGRSARWGIVLGIIIIIVLGVIAWAWIAAGIKKQEQAALDSYNGALNAERSRLMSDVGHASLPVLNPAAMGYRPVASEALIAVQDGVVQLQMKSTGRYSTRGSSISVPIMKGVRYRVGGGSIQTERRLLPTARGRLLITDKALVFEGDQRNERITWAQIADAQLLSDGYQVAKRSGPPRLYQANSPDPHFAAVLQIMLMRTG